MITSIASSFATNRLTRRSFLGGAAGAATLGLVGCGGDTSGGDAADLSTLSVMAPVLDSQVPAADGALQTAVQKLAGATLDITWVANSSYGDRMNVTLASDDLPEVMVVQGKLPAFVQSAQAGAFWDLTDKLAGYPNLAAKDPKVAQAASINGTVYGIFRSRDLIRATAIVRKDWLEKLGAKVPETTAELMELAEAFSTEKPGGPDTYGLIIPKWPGGYGTASPYDVWETWYGAPNVWGERNGSLVPGFDTEEAREADRAMRKMIEAGHVNADFATLDSAKWNEPFFTGKGGIIVDVSSRVGALTTLFAAKDPDDPSAYVEMTGNLIGPDGERHSQPTDGYSGFLAISKQSVPTEQELGAVLKVLDTLSGHEGQVLLNNGIEGENFTRSGQQFLTATEGKDAEVITNDAKSFAQLGTATNGFTAYTAKPATPGEQRAYDRRLALAERDLKTVVYNAAAPVVSPAYISNGAVLDQIIADARVKFMAGQLDDAGYTAEIARWHSTGGDKIVAEVNDLYAKL